MTAPDPLRTLGCRLAAKLSVRDCRDMTETFHFIAAPSSAGEVQAWFRALPHPPEETVTLRGAVLYFREIGPLVLNQDGSPDGARSPVVNLVLPTVRRDILWTTGAVHFLTKPVSQYPEIAKIRRAFAAWIASHPLAYDPHRNAENAFAYYLEGTSPNSGPLFGLPSGMKALSSGRYFVAESDNEHVLDRVCRTLRLRGVECR
mgnify:CR=1 FL=1